jgi:Ca-activated chloride channel family protein
MRRVSWRSVVPVLVALLVGAHRRRERDLAAFVAAALAAAVAPERDPRRRTIRAALVVLAVLALALALGGPMWGFRWEEVRRQGIDLVIAIDTSRSMLATDVKPNRLARAKLAVQDLVAELHGDRVALVAFAGTAFLQCPLTLDYGAFAQSLDAIDAGIIPRGGTSLTAAIDTSLAAFEGRQGTHQALVLITDGEDNEGAVKEATKRAAERGVKVYTVGIGTTEGELIPVESGYVKDRAGQVVKSRLDEEALKQVAVDTGGVYRTRPGRRSASPSSTATTSTRLRRRAVASTLEKRFEHRFQRLALAIDALVLEPLVGERRAARRLPGGGGRRCGREARSPRSRSPPSRSAGSIARQRRERRPGSRRRQVRGIGREVQRGTHRRAGFRAPPLQPRRRRVLSRASPPTRERVPAGADERRRPRPRGARRVQRREREVSPGRSVGDVGREDRARALGGGARVLPARDGGRPGRPGCEVQLRARDEEDRRLEEEARGGAAEEEGRGAAAAARAGPAAART